jgi:NAD(P)-dependent dehydrogenase (short-subunit alcohol dehydrogenase family)
MKELKDRVAVVTGASTGIGRAVAMECGRAGMRVVLASQNAERLAAAVDEVLATGAPAIGVPTDVSDRAAVEGLAEAALREFGAVHLLVNNAGVYAPGYLWEIPLEEWEWVVGVNFWGPLHAIRAFMPHLLAQPEAHIVNVSSAGGLMTAPVHGPYTSSKHALVGLSKGLKADLAILGANVGVTLVCPGMVATNIISQMQTTGPGGKPRPGTELAPEVQAMWDVISTLTNQGIPADGVGPMVIEAVRENRFWLLPNGEQFFEVFEAELEALKAGQ